MIDINKSLTKILVFLVLVNSNFSNGQILFQEDFESGSIPTSMMLWNMDGIGPNVFGDTTWGITDILTQQNGGAYSAFSSNTPGGGNYAAVNDWMVLPQITIPNTGSTDLIFDTKRSSLTGPNETLTVKVSNGTLDTNDFVTIGTYIATDNSFSTETFNLDSYLGQDVYIAIVNQQASGLVMTVDNISVISTGTPVDDAVLEAMSIENIYVSPGVYDLSVYITNNGTTQLNSVDVEYTIDGMSYQSQTLTNLNLSFGQSAPFVLPSFVDLSNTGAYDLEVVLTNPNGGVDNTPLDNTISRPVTVLNNTCLLYTSDAADE